MRRHATIVLTRFVRAVQVLDAAAPGDSLYGKGFVATAERPVTIVWVPSVEGVAGSPASMTASEGTAGSPASTTPEGDTATGHGPPD